MNSRQKMPASLSRLMALRTAVASIVDPTISRSLLATALMGFLDTYARPPGVLAPGADLTDCRSALQLGPAHCEESPQRADVDARPAPGRSMQSLEAQALEDRVDSYLSAYGKPPREAVRALLDPSDEHIGEYLRKQQETLAVAGYVASRMTALQDARQEQAGGPLFALPEPAAFQQIRILLVQSAGDADAREAQRALRELVRHAPALQAGVVLVGYLTSRDLRKHIASIDPMLSVQSRTPEAEDPERLPYVRIEDRRSRRVAVLSARSLTAARLGYLITALRQGDPQDLPADGAAPSRGNHE